MDIDLAVFGSFLVVSGVLGAIGHGLQNAVFHKLPKAEAIGWRHVYYRTLWVHPILAGMVIGTIEGMPCPDFMGQTELARVLWYGLAGSQAHTVLRWIDSEVKSRIK